MNSDRSPKSLWVLITPVYLPAPGGGAIQADTIARALAKAGDDVVILSEMNPGQEREEVLVESPGRARVSRILPFRAGRPRKDWRWYLAYLGTNLRYLQLPGIIRKLASEGNYSSAVILLHTSFLYKPSLLEPLLSRLKAAAKVPTELIAELQDHFFPDSKLPLLKTFDRIVTTSQGVKASLSRRAPERADDITLIPMPFVGPRIPTEDEVERALERYGLRRGRYLLNPSGITGWKHYAQMREAMPILRKVPDLCDIQLVTVGRERDRTWEDDVAEKEGLTRYIGAVHPDEALALMKGAMMTLVLSEREAISRIAVEAMWIGAKIVLPNIAEYRAQCPDHICVDVSPEGIASKVLELRDGPLPIFNFSDHLEDNFLRLYQNLVPVAVGDRGPVAAT